MKVLTCSNRSYHVPTIATLIVTHFQAPSFISREAVLRMQLIFGQLSAPIEVPEEKTMDFDECCHQVVTKTDLAQQPETFSAVFRVVSTLKNDRGRPFHKEKNIISGRQDAMIP